jgi:16S rRNA (guanine527-N7)-methyltransferase
MEKTKGKLELILKYFTQWSPVQIHQLEALDDLYQSWNRKINVISRKDMESLYSNHVLHCLSIAAAFSFPPGFEVLDLGTGGGFPGIPLAIFFPEVHFHLIDSIAKKIKVVEAVAKNLKLSNVTWEQARAESIKGRSFDTVVSRAVAPLGLLWTWSKPLLGKNKKADNQEFRGLIGLKGGDLSQEISLCQCRTEIFSIHDLFGEPYYREKYIVFVPQNQQAAKTNR